MVKVDAKMVEMMSVDGEDCDKGEGDSLVAPHSPDGDLEGGGGTGGQLKDITQMHYFKDALCLLVASCTMLLANKAAVASRRTNNLPNLYEPKLLAALLQVKAFPFVSCLLIMQNSMTFFLIGE